MRRSAILGLLARRRNCLAQPGFAGLLSLDRKMNHGALGCAPRDLQLQASTPSDLGIRSEPCSSCFQRSRGVLTARKVNVSARSSRPRTGIGATASTTAPSRRWAKSQSFPARERPTFPVDCRAPSTMFRRPDDSPATAAFDSGPQILWEKLWRSALLARPNRAPAYAENGGAPPHPELDWLRGGSQNNTASSPLRGGQATIRRLPTSPKYFRKSS
jgi:hypothetical protein